MIAQRLPFSISTLALDCLWVARIPVVPFRQLRPVCLSVRHGSLLSELQMRRKKKNTIIIKYQSVLPVAVVTQFHTFCFKSNEKLTKTKTRAREQPMNQCDRGKAGDRNTVHCNATLHCWFSVRSAANTTTTVDIGLDQLKLYRIVVYRRMYLSSLKTIH